MRRTVMAAVGAGMIVLGVGMAMGAVQEVAVTGMVVGMDGKPMAGVKVRHRLVDEEVVESGAEGRFEMKMAGPAWAWGAYVGETADGTLMGVCLLDGPVQALRMEMRPVGQVEVGVVDGEGKGVIGARVEAYSDGGLLRAAETDGGGKAVLRLPTGGVMTAVVAAKGGVGVDYVLYWKKGEFMNNPYRREADSKEALRLVLKGARTVKVSVVDEGGKAVAGAVVTPWYLEKAEKGGMLNEGVRMFRRETNAAGEAVFDMLPVDHEGPVTMGVMKDGYSSAGRTVVEMGRLEEAERGLKARLLKHVTIRGKVVDAEGKPVEGAEVVMGRAGGAADGPPPRTIESGKDGAFEAELGAEQYYVAYAVKGKEVSGTWRKVVKAGGKVEGPVLTLGRGVRVFGTVTAGPEKKAVKGKEIKLAMRDESYQGTVTEEERLEGVGVYLTVFASQAGKTDGEGQYTFYAAPGKYAIESFLGGESCWKDFELTEEERRVDLHAAREAPLEEVVEGTVTMADTPEVQVEGVALVGQLIEQKGVVGPEGVSGKGGRFRMKAAPCDYWLGAISKDRKHGALMQVKGREELLGVSLVALGSAKGVLVDGEGKAVAGKEVRWSTMLTFGESGGGVCRFDNVYGGKAVTDKEGRFVATGLLEGRTYEVTVEEGEGAASRVVGKVAGEAGKEVEMGDLVVK